MESEVFRLIDASGLSRIEAEIRAAVRPAVRLCARRTVGGTAVGASKLGGLPDLPDSLEWPTRDSAPLAFIAQLNLAELAAQDPDHRLPPAGWLYFFYDAVEQPWQGDMQTECHLASQGVNVGGPPRPTAPLQGDPSDWMLLLQIDSDDAPGTMWGDTGCIYYWIRRDDLARRHFADTWLMLQCC